MTTARSQQVDLSSTPYYHCVNRCVRRAFLCGEDKQTGQNYDHRKGWVVDKIKSLSSIFALDICAYAVMSNHYHVVLRVDQKSALAWSDWEVAERWLQLFKAPLLVQQWLKGNTQTDAEKNVVKFVINDWRERLYNLSWYMRVLNESIARKANEEDQCKGRFWEGRFKSQALLDEAALLSCMAYVDLNPIRAGLADTPESSEFTSIHERLHGWQSDQEASAESDENNVAQAELSSFQGQTRKAEAAIPFTWQDYLTLLDFSGRAIRMDKRGSTPDNYPDILIRLGIEDEDWLNSIRFYEKRFPTVAGYLHTLKKRAEAQGKHWIRGMKRGFWFHGIAG